MPAKRYLSKSTINPQTASYNVYSASAKLVKDYRFTTLGYVSAALNTLLRFVHAIHTAVHDIVPFNHTSFTGTYIKYIAPASYHHAFRLSLIV